MTGLLFSGQSSSLTFNDVIDSVHDEVKPEINYKFLDEPLLILLIDQ